MNEQERLTANLKKLPVTCYFVPPENLRHPHALIRIVRGEAGFYPADNQIRKGETPEAARDRHNGNVGGVTPQQAAAMFNGSLFGFHNPGADPDMYDAEGKPVAAAMVSGLHAEEMPGDFLPPGPMTGLHENDIHAQDAAAEGDGTDDDALSAVDALREIERMCMNTGGDSRLSLLGTVALIRQTANEGIRAAGYREGGEEAPASLHMSEDARGLLLTLCEKWETSEGQLGVIHPGARRCAEHLRSTLESIN